MNNPESTKIIERFYEALRMLIAQKKIRGKKTFTDTYGINRWNLNTVEKNHESDMFQLSWIMHLVADFEVSAEWIMTGKGFMFTSENKNLKAVKKPSGSEEITTEDSQGLS